jgi:hypothetical protein
MRYVGVTGLSPVSLQVRRWQKSQSADAEDDEQDSDEGDPSEAESLQQERPDAWAEMSASGCWNDEIYDGSEYIAEAAVKEEELTGDGVNQRPAETLQSISRPFQLCLGEVVTGHGESSSWSLNGVMREKKQSEEQVKGLSYVSSHSLPPYSAEMKSCWWCCYEKCGLLIAVLAGMEIAV